MSRHLLTALALIAGAASSADAQKAYIAPTNETVYTETDQRQGDPPVHAISVVNRSTVPIVVWSWSLSRCENVKQDCSPRPSNIKVRPNGRSTIVRVQPDRNDRGFTYRFGFSWRADSAGIAAIAALASAGDSDAQRAIEARRRADSISRAETGPRFRELTRDDFRALAGKSVALRSFPDTVVIKPGADVPVGGIRVLVVDSLGNVLGRTEWVRWQTPGSGPVVYSQATSRLAGRYPGQSVVRFVLADEALQLIGRDVAILEVPVVVRHTVVAGAPVFRGRVLDADSQKPLACVRVALEDSAQNVMVWARSGRDGEFTLGAPIPGTYVVRADAHGWLSVRSAPILANLGEEKQDDIPVSFTEQTVVSRRMALGQELEPPRPVSIRTEPVGAQRAGAAPIVQGVTLGGSESMPILGIVTSRVPASTMWFQMSVDSTGALLPASVQLPSGAPATALQALTSALQRMRFAPAKENGRAVCELMRMQVNFTPR